ncbi:hypothetical protein [Nocardia sp. NPDC004123]
MQTGIQGGDLTAVAEPALVTALVAPLVKLRAALGDGTRPGGTALAALAAVPGLVRAAEDAHRGGIMPLASTDTAAAAVPVLTRTGDEVGALADVAETLAPLVTSAYAIRDKAAADLDALIADFRAQATPLVKAARSQADLDSVVSLAADYVRDGVSVAEAADGRMDILTARITSIDQAGVTVPTGLPIDNDISTQRDGQAGTIS